MFAYDRKDHLAATIERLVDNPEAADTDLYIYCDGPRKESAIAGVRDVREFCRDIRGFNSLTVIEREKNWGLLRSMIHGVGEVAQKSGRVIVVEDDIVTAPSFLRFMNEALDFYEPFQSVGSISGYLAPMVSRRLKLSPNETFFSYRTNCWGWATWSDRWSKANWEPQDWQTYLYSERTRPLLARGGSDLLYMMERSFSGQNQSWMARWYYNCMMHGMLTLYPARSLTDNIGFDGTGTHSTNAKASVFARYRADTSGLDDYRARFSLPVVADDRAHRLMRKFWDAPWWVGSPTGRLLKKCYTASRSILKGGR